MGHLLSCWQNLPQLNPEVGIPTIQLVGPEMTKEELLELYLEVYKLHRLPESPPREPAILKEVLSSSDHQRCEEEKAPAAMAWPHPEGSQSSRSGTPTEEGRMTWWKVVWPWYTRPIKKHWPHWLPLRRK